MRTLLLLLMMLAFPSMDEVEINLEREFNPGARSTISDSKQETVSASIDNSILSITIENFTGPISYQVEDFDGVVVSNYCFISGDSTITENLSLLESGLYTLKIYTGYYYTGSFSL